MLCKNIRAAREAKGLSQVELAAKLNVVRQTISKWERNLSVPDAELLVSLSDALNVSVADLLGEGPAPVAADSESAEDLRAIAEKLEVVNLQLARQGAGRRRAMLVVCAVAVAAMLLGLVWAFAMGSPYLGWDLGDPETAVLATMFHGIEWAFVRAAPLLLVAAGIGIFLVARRH